MLTLGVVKNIIPAIASTNAIIAAACSNECIKILSYIAPSVDNYMMYMGKTGVNISAFAMEQKENCFVCNNKATEFEFRLGETVQDAVLRIEELMNVQQITLSCEDGKYIYAARPKALYEAHKHKLDKTFRYFFL